MRALMGLLPPMAGKLRFKGDECGELAPHQRARCGIGYVPQGCDVFPRLSVAENLRVCGSMRRASVAEYERAYGIFPILRERRQQRTGTLSGGQQQQMAIGRVLVGRPSLLLDEPSEGIQPSVVQDIARIVLAFRA